MRIFALCMFICSVHYIHASPYNLRRQVNQDEILFEGSEEETIPLDRTYADTNPIIQNQPIIIAEGDQQYGGFTGIGASFGETTPPQLNQAPVQQSTPSKPQEVQPDDVTPATNQKAPQAPSLASAEGKACKTYDGQTAKYYSGKCHTAPNQGCDGGGLDLRSDDCEDFVDAATQGIQINYCCVPKMHCAIEPYLKGWCVTIHGSTCAKMNGKTVSSKGGGFDCPGSDSTCCITDEQ